MFVCMRRPRNEYICWEVWLLSLNSARVESFMEWISMVKQLHSSLTWLNARQVSGYFWLYSVLDIRLNSLCCITDAHTQNSITSCEVSHHQKIAWHIIRQRLLLWFSCQWNRYSWLSSIFPSLHVHISFSSQPFFPSSWHNVAWSCIAANRYCMEFQYHLFTYSQNRILAFRLPHK